jgi:plasmid stabilization system protein ParE
VEITVLAGAEDELLSAWQNYEEWMPGLGARFDEAYLAAVEQLLIFPNSAPRYAGQFRRKLVDGFDHGIFYQVHGKRIVVSAVLLLTQDPAAILKRLGL